MTISVKHKSLDKSITELVFFFCHYHLLLLQTETCVCPIKTGNLTFTKDQSKEDGDQRRIQLDHLRLRLCSSLNILTLFSSYEHDQGSLLNYTDI